MRSYFCASPSLYCCATANHGTYAVELYKKYHPDLITLDIMMPNMDGIEALKEDAGANIMMVSALRGDSMLRCMVLGAKGYVEKPLQFHNPLFVKYFIDIVAKIIGNI